MADFPLLDEFDLASLDLEHADGDDAFVHAGFELLKEAAVVAAIVAGASERGRPVDRNEGIARANLIRVVRLDRSMIRQVADGHGGDQQLPLNRQILDTAANLAYLLEGDTEHPDRFDAYVSDSLIAEREFLRDVRNQIDLRGGARLRIEDRIENSIRETLDVAGVDEADIPGRRANGWPTAEARVRLLGPIAYSAYRTSSAAMHGTFSDLHLHYMDRDEGGSFTVREPSYPFAPQILLTSGLLTIRSAALLLRTYFTPVPAELRSACERIEARLRTADGLHERAIERRRARRD